MVKGSFPVDKLRVVETPFYFYDLQLLKQNLEAAKTEAERYGYHVHYAVKANANDRILETIAKAGFGADCVSGGEVEASIKAGFPAGKVVFAGVGKADWEINLGLDNDIFCFNAESIPELEVIDELAAAKGKKARVALRINPNVDAHTHHYITTGLNENKFGFNMEDMSKVVDLLKTLTNVELVGIHFHIGSQITDMCPFQNLCVRVNEIQDFFEQKGFKLEHVNVGGGLGINYQHPNHVPISDFEAYFKVFHNHLQLRPRQQLHFELGRAMVASCGSLITKVLYVKEGTTKKFAIVDAGMTDLIRPALYQAYHHIENITSDEPFEPYDVVGPICESSDTFGTARMLNGTKRGDLIALRSAGAYGEIMASRYNLRKLPGVYYSDQD
ncbi:diaminopimelate decarboxylase [Paludibacter jiangxiensis]|uniref:Diaminopimelate decarboxylase n=1 Tax=Paludibacter jiangxiensis TaxID=681398 RepID=A0A161LEB1_9BACT|nr:diaminopimelate decarboxylase [Paludibacter jiangxiensis]GAT62547.1 diaminopimelate decarboxylase [Paludibacter jiangxiensis]